MERTRRFGAACRILAALFVIIAAARLATAAVPLWDPVLSTAYLSCDPCQVRTDPVLLIEREAERKLAWQNPGTARELGELIETRNVRLMLFSAQLIAAIPFFALFVSLALALRHLAARGFSIGAIRWLRRGAFAAILWALAQPIAQSIRSTAFSPISGGGEAIHVMVNLNQLLWPALLGGAVWICVWALEEALILRTDLEEYV